MLKENTLFGIRDKVSESIKLIKEHEPDNEAIELVSGGMPIYCAKCGQKLDWKETMQCEY